MQTQMLEKDATRAKFKVEVPAKEVSDAYQAILRDLAKQVRVPGFRPGKAPRGVIEARVGKDAIAQEVRDALVGTYYPRAARELELTPVHQHIHAHEPVEGEDYAFEVEVELYPEVNLPDPSQIVLDSEGEPLTDETVQETIETLRRQHATLVPVERAAEAGDVLTVETSESGSSMPIDLETVAPEFAEQFYGKTIGEAVELNLGTPNIEEDGEGEGAVEGITEEPSSTDPAQAAPTLRVTITDIKAKELPDADDEFAKTLGFDTWEEAEAQIRRSLQVQLDQEALSAQGDEFVEKLLLESDLEIPRSLVERRKGTLLSNLAEELQERGLSMKEYLAQLDEDGKREAFEGELEEAAVNAVKRDLVLEKLLETRGTTVSNEEFEAAVAYMAQRQGSTPAKLRQELGQDGLANYRFLLARDKAVRESVQELLAAQRPETRENADGATPEADATDTTPTGANDTSDNGAEASVESEA